MRQSIIIFLLFVLAACHHAPVPVHSAKNIEKYQFTEIRQGNVGALLQLPAVLYPYYRVDMYPKVNGFVKELYVDRGSIVHQGQTLVVLEAPEINQMYFSSQSKYPAGKSALYYK